MIPYEKLAKLNARSMQDITDFIFVSDEPETSDIIMIPGSQERLLAEHAAKLWKEGYAPRICVSGRYGLLVQSFAEELQPELRETAGHFETEAAYLRDVLTLCGVDETAIVTEDESRSTFENAYYSARLLRDLGCKSMLLVCQAYHARRALMTFSYAMPDIVIRVCPVITKNTSRDTWTATERSYRRVMSELKKCGDYFCREE